jgi:alpha/beta superfamily hydrolase
MKKLKSMLFIVLGLLTISVNGQVFDVPYKEDAPTRTLLMPAQKPKAVVLLFIGGPGMLNLKEDGSTNNTHTFTRSKALWAQYDVDAVLVDTPYSLGGGKNDVRPGKDHQQRILTVVNYYKEKLKVPVWIFGHSRGSISVSEFVNGSEDRDKIIAGVIIAASISTVSIKSSAKSPVLAVHHKQDGCHVTPYKVSEEIIKKRPSSTIAKLVLVEGGITEGEACGSKAYHGFNQKEPELIKEVSQFILNH